MEKPDSTTTNLASFRPTSGTPRLSDITKFDAELPLPQDGPWREFVDAAAEAGYASDHASACWIFSANNSLANRITYTFLGDLRRLSPVIILAGDEALQNINLRKVVRGALITNNRYDLFTNFEAAQEQETLDAFQTQNMRTVISFDNELPLKKWQAARKTQISIQELIDQYRLNLNLNRRPTGLGPAAVSALASHPLGPIAIPDINTNIAFEQTLVIPAFGASGISMPSPLLKRLKYKLCSLDGLSPQQDLILRMNEASRTSWQTIIQEHKSRMHTRMTLGSELSSWRRRSEAYLKNLIEIATAHAANRSAQVQPEFNPNLLSEDLIFADSFLQKLEVAWNILESLYAQTKEVEIAKKFHRRICFDFSDKHNTELNGILVKTTELIAKYCQHPSRDGHYSSRDFETRVLGELCKQGLAQRHPQHPKNWIIR